MEVIGHRFGGHTKSAIIGIMIVRITCTFFLLRNLKPVTSIFTSYIYSTLNYLKLQLVSDFFSKASKRFSKRPKYIPSITMGLSLKSELMSVSSSIFFSCRMCRLKKRENLLLLIF